MGGELLFIYDNSKPLDMPSLFPCFPPRRRSRGVQRWSCGLDLKHGAVGKQIPGEVVFTKQLCIVLGWKSVGE